MSVNGLNNRCFYTAGASKSSKGTMVLTTSTNPGSEGDFIFKVASGDKYIEGINALIKELKLRTPAPPNFKISLKRGSASSIEDIFSLKDVVNLKIESLECVFYNPVNNKLYIAWAGGFYNKKIASNLNLNDELHISVER